MDALLVHHIVLVDILAVARPLQVAIALLVHLLQEVLTVVVAVHLAVIALVVHHLLVLHVLARRPLVLALLLVVGSKIRAKCYYLNF